MIKIGNNNFLNLKDIANEFNIQTKDLMATLDKERIKYTYLSDTPYILESEFLKLFKSQDEIGQVSSKVYPVTEREIMEETIKVLQYKKVISIKELREYLKQTMKLSDEDLIINKNRKDTRFDQKVRNLISHRDGNGLLNYCIYENGYLSLKEE